MSLKDIALVQAYHADRVKRFGVDTAEALGWKNEDSQQQRFHELSQIGDLAGRTVLDVGCGHGDLYPYLKQQHGDFHYTGLDNVRDFLEVAAGRFHDHWNTKFLLGDFSTLFLPKADFVVCCGALNYRNSDPNYLYKMINRFFDATAVGLGISLLSRVDFSNGILASYEPEEVVKFCEQLSSRVEVKESSEQGHFTLFLYRESAQH